MNPSQIPAGVATKAGLTGAASSFALALVAFIMGDRSTETVGALVASLVLLVTTMVGRYAQATARALVNPPDVKVGKNTLRLAATGLAKGSTLTDAASGGGSGSLVSTNLGGGGGGSVRGVQAVRSWLDVDDTDDEDLPADGELKASARIPVDPVSAVPPDQGDPGRPHVELDKSEGGVA